MRLLAPVNAFPIVNDDKLMEVQFMLFINDVVAIVNHNSIIIGTGSPEGSVEAIQGREYMDDAGTAGAIKYIKRDNDIAGDTTKGWILI